MKRIIALLYVFLAPVTATAADQFADGHIHFNWDQKEIISAQEVAAILKAHRVGLTIVAGTPTQLALELRKAAGEWVIPFFSPYTHELGKRDWFLHDNVVAQAEQGLQSGQYFGIGEVHFMAGFLPRTNNKVFLGLVGLAEKYRVPMLIHVDAGSERYFLDICQSNPKVTLILAHAGGNLYPSHIEKILTQCQNTWVEFSARDPWRYGGITDNQNRLLPAWEKIAIDFQDRIYTGTDPVWRVTRTQSWDQADDGWDHYQELYEFHQTWLGYLPAEVQTKLAWSNLNRLLGIVP